MQDKQLDAVWGKILKELEGIMTPLTFRMYIQSLTPVGFNGNKIVLTTKSQYFLNTITEKLVAQIKRAIASADTFVSDFELHGEGEKADIVQLKGLSFNKSKVYPIDSKYTFEAFVVGSSNKMVHAAAKAVANAPGEAFNPLFIYGASGLGKTHILQAIANQISASHPEKKVVYLPCDSFVNEFIESIGTNRTAEFRARYRSVDVLLIDDIQFLAKKEACQEEFFHTFNELYSQKKQIVLSSDTSPSEIKVLSDRLKTRVEWGLKADIQPPDLETKIAILHKKAFDRKFTIDTEVLAYLADNSPSDVRALEGRLNKVIFASILHEVPITVNLAKSALKEAVGDEGGAITAEDIIDSVISFYKIKRQDLLGKRKNKEFVEPRQICTYLICELLELPLVTIGMAMGGRDHTTVIHSRNKIAELISVNDRIAKDVNDLKNIILKK